jgi:tetratricopeptide (TPR) repeat protein
LRPNDLDREKPIRRIRVFVLLAATFVLKILVLVQLKDHPLLQADAGLDTSAYVTLAHRVLAGNWGLGPDLYFVSPFYIYFLAIGLALCRTLTGVRIVQVVLGTAAVGFIFAMTREWFGERAAWIAAILAALTGLLTFYEVLILQSSIDVFLASAALYALTKRKPFAAGVLFGLQTLNRPNVLIAAAGIALVMLALRRVRPAIWLGAGIAIGLAPVAIRNVVVSHEWTLVSSHGGLNFYIGNNGTATGLYQLVPGVSPTIGGQANDVRRVASRALGHVATDAEASDYFFGLGRTWLVDHPGAAAALFARKIVYVFSAAHLPLPQSYPFYAYDAGTALRFLVVGPWLLVPIGLAGLLFVVPASRRTDYVIWASFVPAYACAVALFFVAERYRLPVLVPLYVTAGGAIDAVLRRSHLVPLLAAGAVAAVVVNWPLHVDDGRWIEGLRLAQQLVIHQRYDEAEAWARRLDATNPPHPGAGRYGVGSELLTLDLPQRALPDLEAAHASDPGNAAVDYALGQALFKLGRVQDALPHLRHGFDGGADIPMGGYDYADALRAAGDDAGAAAALRRLNPPDTGDVDAWLRPGRLAMEVHAAPDAERFFRRGVELRPDLAATHQQYGLNLLVLGRFDEAARELGDAARLDPRDADTLSHLAYCELRLGKSDEARAHAAAALAINPDDQLARQIAAAR